MIKDKPCHGECFKCLTCSTPLAGKPFIQNPSDSKEIYCQDHYWEKFSPRCGHCDEIIKGQYIQAMGKYWHENHFVCSECGSEFASNQFHRHNDRPYCREHYLQVSSPHCEKCKKAIVGVAFEALERKFHSECFICSSGDHTIPADTQFYVVGDAVWCKDHYHKRFVVTCNDCNQVIEGEYLKLGDMHLHPGCFKCSGCATVITSETAKQNMGIFYCPSCYATAERKSGESPVIAQQLAAGVTGDKEAGGASGGGSTSGGGAGSPDKKDGKYESKGSAGGGHAGGDKKASGGGASGGGSSSGGDSKAAEGNGEIKIDVFYTYDVLNKKDGLPKLVAENPNRKESFLSDADFAKVFGADRAKFNSWPKWKRDSEKKKVGLF